MIFRWTIWGDKEKSLELLKYSFLSFRKQFGGNHRYIIFTDNASQVKERINSNVEIIQFQENDQFNIDSVATWKKWCPVARVDVSEDEFYIDSDVFLVNHPKEIFDFLDNHKYKFAILDEFKGQDWQHGSMYKKATEQTPFINAGLFIQKSGSDITKDLLSEFKWWKENIKTEEQKHHDEQGALAIALTKYLVSEELYILPKNKYLLIGENENTEIQNLKDIVLFHAVYPKHPAFYKFKNDLGNIYMNKDTKKNVAVLMTVKDEEEYIDYNISYHLDLGFDYIFIANHNSTDKTNRILNSYSYKNNSKVVVIEEKDSVFDHAKIANRLLEYVKNNYEIDWFIFLDADEFLSLKDDCIHDFVNRLEEKQIPYATIGWVNALFDYTMSDYTCSPITSIDTTKYYLPRPEKEWQEGGHFRKTIVKNHKNMEIVVGGHFVETGNNIEFFGEYHWNPFIVPYEQAKILHFEFRGNAQDIYNKWEKLATFENDSTSDGNAPWLERIKTIRKYVEKFKNNVKEINNRWFKEHRTFWGTPISEDRIIYDTTLSIWYRRYFRNKIEKGGIRNVCLVRDKNLGDIIMTEPVADFLSQYVDEVYLATDIQNADQIFNTYNRIIDYKKVNEVDAKLKIKLIHELGDNDKSYIQSYMKSIGFGEILNKDIPKLNQEWSNIIDESYILLAPFTSSWQENKRNWGYKNYAKLKTLLENKLKIRCVFLEEKYSFQEMMSLVKHCKFFVGNDSGPAVIAQSFDKKSFVIFGATSPKYLHLSQGTVSIYDKNRHKLCNHKNRQEEIDCCEEFCMKRIKVTDVFDIIKRNI